MKAAIYNPYWDTLGGGERYTASFISLLLRQNYSVDIEWKNENILKKISNRFDIDITKANVVESVNRGDGYDLLFWLSDGSIPTLKSRNNILHFQFPFQDTHQNVLFTKMKFFRIKTTVCNSEFTKQFIDKEFNINSDVIYPPVDTTVFTAGKKENVILYVGRFSQLTQSKNQHILIDEFKKMYDDGFKDWKLVLAGGGEVGAEKYIETLKSASKSYPISVIVSPSFNKLKELYSKSKIFWSAVGVGVKEVKDPLKVEHFGMTVVEAMSAGCVPVVTEKGGYKEIVYNQDNGLFWSESSELRLLTKKLAENKKLLKDLSMSAQGSSKKFDTQEFEQKFLEIL